MIKVEYDYNTPCNAFSEGDDISIIIYENSIINDGKYMDDHAVSIIVCVKSIIDDEKGFIGHEKVIIIDGKSIIAHQIRTF